MSNRPLLADFLRKGPSERCGNNALQVIIGLQMGRIDPAKDVGCTVALPPMFVVNTTSDGWSIVQTGDSMTAAIEGLGTVVDGSLVRRTEVVFLGVQAFETTLGTEARLPAFSVAKSDAQGRIRDRAPGGGL